MSNQGWFWEDDLNFRDIPEIEGVEIPPFHRCLLENWPRWQSSTLPLAMDAWHMIQGLQMIAWRIIKIEGPGLVDEERPRVLDPSSEHYIRRAPHTD
ncbi:hypothetical protein Tco_1487089 [Tanacetum coccineum]